MRDQADRLGVTVPIEALYGQGKTADQVSQALAAQLDTVPEPERIAFVETVAITLAIPVRGEPKGPGICAMAGAACATGSGFRSNGYSRNADPRANAFRRCA
nr:hypothetical protein [Pseudomonas syringae]